MARSALVLGFIVALCTMPTAAWADPRDDVEFGYQLALKGAYDLAIDYTTRAIDSGELNDQWLVNALVTRGTALFHKGRDRDALRDFNEVLSIDPDVWFALRTRGSIHISNGSFNQAIKDFTAAIRINPDDADAYAGRAAAHAEMGAFDLAFADFDTALRLDPDDPITYLERARAHWANAALDRAIADYDLAISLDPNAAEPFVSRGMARRQIGEFDRAIADYNTALGLDPAAQRAYRERGITKFFLGDFSDAATDLRLALQENPEDHFVVLWLYLAEERSGVAGADSFVANAARLDLAMDPSPVLLFYLDETTAAQVLAAAPTIAHPEELKQYLCTAYYFLGQDALLNGRENQARYFFREVIRTDVKLFPEYAGAQAELERLGQQFEE